MKRQEIDGVVYDTYTAHPESQVPEGSRLVTQQNQICGISAIVGG